MPVDSGSTVLAPPWRVFSRSYHSTPRAALYSVSHSSQTSFTPLIPPFRLMCV